MPKYTNEIKGMMERAARAAHIPIEWIQSVSNPQDELDGQFSCQYRDPLVTTLDTPSVGNGMKAPTVFITTEFSPLTRPDQALLISTRLRLVVDCSDRDFVSVGLMHLIDGEPMIEEQITPYREHPSQLAAVCWGIVQFAATERK